MKRRNGKNTSEIADPGVKTFAYTATRDMHRGTFTPRGWVSEVNLCPNVFDPDNDIKFGKKLPDF